jgi:(p)ppGpp synthase/HD superfamily hydrolase
MTPDLKNALKVAYDAHKGQTRRNGRTPYIEHPIAVAKKVHTDQQKMVAMLHDVIEDTTVSAEFLKVKGIPSDVIDAVKILTKRKGDDYMEYLKRVKENPLALSVKLADIDHNLHDSPSEKQKLKYKKALEFLNS